MFWILKTKATLVKVLLNWPCFPLLRIRINVFFYVFATTVQLLRPETRGGWQRGLEPSLHDRRNSAEWNWVQIFLENKYGGGWRNGRTMSFCSVLRFPVYKYHEKVSMNFFNGPFGHQEPWCVKSSWVTSLIVIRDLGKFSYF